MSDTQKTAVSGEISTKVVHAEPAVLGLTGLAVAALVLSLTDLGAVPVLKSLMIPWTLFMGAIAQLIAGIIDFKRNNIFGGTAFTTYSLLWLAVSLTYYITTFTDIEFSMDHYAIGLIGFLVFSLFVTVASMMTNTTLFAVLVFIDLAILTLVLQILAGSPPELVGVFLLLVSLASFYGAAGIMINTMHGHAVLPLGKALWKPHRVGGES